VRHFCEMIKPPVKGAKPVVYRVKPMMSGAMPAVASPPLITPNFSVARNASGCISLRLRDSQQIKK